MGLTCLCVRSRRIQTHCINKENSCPLYQYTNPDNQCSPMKRSKKSDRYDTCCANGGGVPLATSLMINSTIPYFHPGGCKLLSDEQKCFFKQGGICDCCFSSLNFI